MDGLGLRYVFRSIERYRTIFDDMEEYLMSSNKITQVVRAHKLRNWKYASSLLTMRQLFGISDRYAFLTSECWRKCPDVGTTQYRAHEPNPFVTPWLVGHVKERESYLHLAAQYESITITQYGGVLVKHNLCHQ